MKNIGKKRKNIWLDVIKDIWNGEHSLVYSFWILYVVYISALAGIAFYFGEMLDESSIFGILLYIIFLVFIYI